MTEALSPVAEDFYAAMARALSEAPHEDAAVAVQALRQGRDWRALGPDVRAVFAAAAASFISES